MQPAGRHPWRLTVWQPPLGGAGSGLLEGAAAAYAAAGGGGGGVGASGCTSSAASVAASSVGHVCSLGLELVGQGPGQATPAFLRILVESSERVAEFCLKSVRVHEIKFLENRSSC